MIATVIFVMPAGRRNWVTLNVGAVLIFAGVYIEKGMGLVIPGMTPDTLGEIYEYRPSMVEWMVAIGIFGLGALVFTTLVNVAVPIDGNAPGQGGAGGSAGSRGGALATRRTTTNRGTGACTRSVYDPRPMTSDPSDRKAPTPSASA